MKQFYLPILKNDKVKMMNDKFILNGALDISENKTYSVFFV